MTQQIMFLHIGYQVDGSEKTVMSLNDQRDTSASYAIRTFWVREMKVTMWFYGVKKTTEYLDSITQQTKRAIESGSFSEWFKQ